jgi:hypothetical protein
VKTTPHAGRGNSAQTGTIADVTEQRANEHKNQLLQQNTWRETCSSKQMDDTPCEVELNSTKVMKIVMDFILLSALQHVILAHMNAV